LRRISAAEAAKLAAESAEKTRLELLRRQEEAAQRRARARKQNIIFITAASIVLGIMLLSGSLYIAVTPSAARISFGQRVTAADRFTATRTGVIRFEESGRKQCRQTEFDNATGQVSNETLVPCFDPKSVDASARLPQSQASDRFDAIRGSFIRN
jgi:hypothetical protein